MLTTDPIADMLTRIRNALVAKHEVVDMPASNMKKAIAQILVNEGYIKGFETVDVEEGAFKNIRITLKYGPNRTKVITGLKRISKPGLRVYARKDQIPRVLNGLGIAVLSTSRGLMTDREARKQAVGGEVLAYIW
jgi:small subunit ribosomal protein S8